MKIEDFEGKGPVFTPEEFFDGELVGWGVMESPLGSLQKRYTVKAAGRWDRGTGVISFTETWTFDDGHVDTLNWQIRPLGDGKYTGSEPLLDGEAEGDQAGFAYHWRYTRETPQPDGKTVKLNFDDWFWRIDDAVVIVKGTAGRLGLPFATAHVTYQKIR
jgi:hypothetical protein